MICGAALLTLNDATLKWLTADYPVGQVLFMRGLFVFFPIAFLAWRAGGRRSLRLVNLRGQALRAGLVVASTFTFITALSLMPLANAIAISFAGPLFLTALARPLLGEVVGWRRWSAVLLGLAGVVVMVQPGAGAFQWIALLPLGAAFLGALRDIVTRRLSVTDSSISILFCTTLAVTLAGLATFPLGWNSPKLGDIALLAIAGFLLGAAHFLLIETFRFAEAALVAPFKYSSMIWAVLFGYLLWGELPGVAVLTGSTLVVASGLYILHRETRRKKAGA